MLVITVGRASRTEEALGRGAYVAMIRELNEDGSESYVAHRYGASRNQARDLALDYVRQISTEVRP